MRRRRALWRFLLSLCRAADAPGAAVHLVGGSVRDLVEGRPGNDVDLMVSGIGFDDLGKVLASLPAKRLGIRRIAAAGRNFPVYKVKSAWLAHDIDVAPARPTGVTGPGRQRPAARARVGEVRADASRRDFTINSLVFAFRLRGNGLDGELIDFFGGLSDLRRRRIRGVGDPRDRILEDPLRMMRAIRMKNERPGYAIDPGTWRAILEKAPSVAATVSPERTFPEILRSLAANSAGALGDLRRSGILRAVLPEARGTSLARMKRRYALLEQSLGRPLPGTVLAANLLLDVAAAEARAPGPAAEAKVIRLPGTEAVARRLHVPGVRRVVQLIGDLHRLSGARSMRNPNAGIEAVFARWENPRWLLALYEADRIASARRAEDFRPLLRKAARTRPLLSGEDVLAAGVAAGPEVEWILECVREATLAGKVRSRDGAAALAASLAADGTGPPGRKRRIRSGSSTRRSPPGRKTRIAPSA